jgi:hypothetical protein
MKMTRAALLPLLLILWACSGGGPAPSPCKPPVEGIVWEGTPDPAVSRQMEALVAADGADRSTPTITLAALQANDENRRTETMSYLQTGKIALPEDLFRAAVIFSRGTCPDHQELAVRAARRAWERGVAEAWNLYQQTGIRWMEAQGEKPRVVEGRLRAWPDLESLNRRLWAKGDGTCAVPLKLPASLEPRRAELESALLAAQRRVRESAQDLGWEQPSAEGLLDRVAVFETKTDLDRVVNQLRETASTDPVDPLLAGLLEVRALVVLAPESAAALHPAFAGDSGWEGLLAMALARPFLRRIAGSEEAMGPPWFHEGLAAHLARIPMKSREDFKRQDLQAILDGRAPLDPQACGVLYRSTGGPATDPTSILPRRGPVTVNLDELK